MSSTKESRLEEDAASNTKLKELIRQAATSLGYDLKKEQEESILQLISGRDVFVSLPTGFGKSLCYILLPCVFDLYRQDGRKSIVLVVSPLIALMKDQVASITAMGISAVYITDKQTTTSTAKTLLQDGGYQIIFISPEALFCGTEWRRLLSTDVYRESLAAFIVDEAHCIRKWGDDFRKEFAHLDEIRSIVPQSVRVMALTATATLSTRKFVIKSLNMQKPAIVYVPPVKSNIAYYVEDKPREGIHVAFRPLVDRLIQDRNMGRVIIFCRTYENVISIHKYFVSELGPHLTEPKGSPNYVVYRVVDMYTHCTHPTIKNKILKQFTSPSPLRVVIATIAFGMGINCPDVRQVIHWGVPQDAEMYVQESGRAGRDGKFSCALVFKGQHDLDKRYTSKQMIDYCTNKESVCRRGILYSDFPGCNFSSKGCMCCDICKRSCTCGHCESILSSFMI